MLVQFKNVSELMIVRDGKSTEFYLRIVPSFNGTAAVNVNFSPIPNSSVARNATDVTTSSIARNMAEIDERINRLLAD